MYTILPHSTLSMPGLLDELASAVLQADANLNGSDLRWKDVRDNSFLQEWRDEEWARFRPRRCSDHCQNIRVVDYHGLHGDR